MSDEKKTAAVSEGCLSIPAAQEFTGLGRSFLYGEMDRGNIPYVKVGRRRLIPKRALVDYLRGALVGR